MMSKNIQAAGLPLVLIKKEVRVDSRVLAEMLGIKNRVLIQNIETHQADFQSFGIITFKMGKLKEQEGDV